MPPAVIQFIVVALLSAIFLWVLSQFPTLDPGIVRFIRIVIYVVLSLMLLNCVLVLLFGKGIAGFLGT